MALLRPFSFLFAGVASLWTYAASMNPRMTTKALITNLDVAEATKLTDVATGSGRATVAERLYFLWR